MVARPSSVSLNLLGNPSLEVAGKVRFLERKTAGVLAYIALERQVSREQIASLLWPDVLDRSARTNLRQVLWRLRSYETDVVVGQGLLMLDPAVQVDVRQFKLATLEGRDLEQASWQGELLNGKDFSDCPSFEEWLQGQRRHIGTLWKEALWQGYRSAQETGDSPTALQRLERLIALDPLSEQVYRLLMTLHAASGNRAAALAIFHDCQTTLKRELGVLPATETLLLAEEIRQADRTDAPLPAPIPAAIWQPPLVGREVEWQQLNKALNAGQMVIIGGPPGIGKTCLLLETLRMRGVVLRIESRPNDEAVPYLALSRLVRQLLKVHQEAAQSNPPAAPPVDDWVLAEAALLLPDVQPKEPALAPLNPALAQRRFLGAITRLVTALLPLAFATQSGYRPEADRGLLFDNEHWTDERSWEAWLFIFSQPEWQALGIHVGMTFRQGELSAARLESIARLVDGDAAITVDLRPLQETDTGALAAAFLAHQETAPVVAPGLVNILWRHTGGNPLFVLETLRALMGGGELTAPGKVVEALPVPPRLEQLLRRRLERVSDLAIRLARVAAVAGAEFDAELAAHVLDLRPLDLVHPWAELEAAQIMGRTGFAHDMVAQAAERSVPLAVRALLHGSIAEHLQGRAAAHPRVPAPEHLALHWEAGGQPFKAAPHWVRAGWLALSRGALTNAAADFRRAITTGDAGQIYVLDAQYGLGLALRDIDPSGAEQALLSLLPLTPGLVRTVEIHVALAELYRLCGRLEDALVQTGRATDLADQGLPDIDHAGVWRTRFAVHLRAGQYKAAEEAILTAQALAPESPEMLNEHALLFWMSGRLEEAAQLYGRVKPQPVSGDQPRFPSWYAGNLGWTYWALGRLAEAEAVLAPPMTPPGSPFDIGVRLVHQATVSISQGRYHKALSELDAAEPALIDYPPHLVDLWHRRGLMAAHAARYDEATTFLKRAVEAAQEVGDPVRLSLALSGLVQVQVLLGRETEAEYWAQAVRELAVHVQVPLVQILANQALALLALLTGNRAQAAELADEAVGQARACQMRELLARSLVIRASCDALADTRADLLEATQLAKISGLLEVEYEAVRTLATMDPEWMEQADNLYEQLLALAPKGFLDALPAPYWRNATPPTDMTLQ